MNKKDPALVLNNVSHFFHQGGKQLDVLKGVDLVINKGDIVALVGPSGAGKSTLLQIAGLLESPRSGDIFIDGSDVSLMNDFERTKTRRENLGFVYQYHHLLPEFSACENIMIPQIIKGIDRMQAKDRALVLLETVGLKDRAEHRPTELSGGEQQRVAICRALANKPTLLLADEPTGNLDPETGQALFENLYETIKREQTAAFIVTHNMALADQCDHVFRLDKGLVV